MSEEKRRPSRKIEIRTTTPPPGESRDFNLSKNIRFQAFFISERGEFLNASVEAESELSFVIQLLLTGETTNTTLFKTIILDRFSFGEKRRVFAELFRNVPWVRPLVTKYRKLPQNLESLISIRNKFAHGKLFFSNDTPYLEFFRGKVRQDVISEETIKADLKEIALHKDELSNFAHDLIALLRSKNKEHNVA